MRTASVKRKTKETEIAISLNLEGKGESRISTKMLFLNHLLEVFSKQGLFDLEINATGDIERDDHHLVEDVGIVLGDAFRGALGSKAGIARYGFFVLPLDESLALAAIDLSGRPALVFDAAFTREKVGDLSTEVVCDFFKAFSDSCEANVHIKLFYGRNDHHKIEAIFKAFARALRAACEIDERAKGSVPSSKGVL